ncbi:MAG: hypothetical protein JWQ33_223 [Ramlibacter sp.]|nr:hypothetical protein [Ramlibacter sp.]
MNRALRLTLLWSAAALALIAAALVFAYLKLVPGDDELTEQIRAQAEARLGVEVHLGSAHLQLWPHAELVIEDASTVQPEPVRIKRLVAEPRLSALLRGRVELDDVSIDGAVLPQLSLGALRMRPAPQQQEGKAVQVAQIHFRDTIWITRYGTPLEFEGYALFGPEWQLRDAEIVRPGVRPVTRLALAADGQERWKVELQLGGGSANGEVMLKAGKDGGLALTGRLAPRNIDITGALTSFKRHSAVAGKASGSTELTATGNNVGDLARSLHTRTAFTVAEASLVHIDVDKAIRSFGKDRAGETPLRSLGGQMDTQNTPSGMVVRYTGLQAKGDTFSATGAGTIANRRVEGAITVDLVGGLVGVPLKISGPLAQPQVTVPAGTVAGATAGAVVGTAVLPGIGTAIGAGIGATLGKLFGGGEAKRPAPAR